MEESSESSYRDLSYKELSDELEKIRLRLSKENNLHWHEDAIIIETNIRLNELGITIQYLRTMFTKKGDFK